MSHRPPGWIDRPLGDASEVYDVTAEGDGAFRVRHGAFAGLYDDADVSLIVDEIWKGKAHLALTADDTDDGDTWSGAISLSPEEAHRFGHALIRAAAYAERQGGDS